RINVAAFGLLLLLPCELGSSGGGFKFGSSALARFGFLARLLLGRCPGFLLFVLLLLNSSQFFSFGFCLRLDNRQLFRCNAGPLFNCCLGNRLGSFSFMF